MKRIKIMLVTVAAAPLLLMGTAMAETNNSGTGSTDNKTTTSDQTKSTDDPKVDAARLKERFDKYKADLKVKLTDLEQKRIVAKCKVGQVVVKTLHTRQDVVKSNRGVVQDTILDKISAIVTKLKANGVDTTTVEANLATAKTKSDALKTELDAYRQTLSDLQAMDCASDPAGFKAALEDARSDRAQLVKDWIAYKTYVKDTLIKSLKDLKTQIKADATTEDKAATGGTN